MLHVESVCTPCCTLLRVVGSCCAKFETGQTFSYVQTEATLLGVIASVWHVAYGLNQIPFSEPLRGEHADECKCSCLNFPVKTNVLYILIPSSLTR